MSDRQESPGPEAVPEAPTAADAAEAAPAEAPAEAELPATAPEAAAAEPEEKPAEAEEKTTDTEAKPAEPKPHRKPRFPALARAFRSGRAVEGTVEKVIKGGYEIRVGKARAFCPHSQIDVHRENDPDGQLGKSYEFKITQLRRGGEDVVVSRRALLEADREDLAKAVRATLIEGAVMQGRVVNVAQFGAFIDLGAGVLGLAHISELSHNRIREVSEAVKIGDTVPVRILKLKEGGRISLSVRRAQDDPWVDVATRFEVGKSYPGTIQRLADFGAFVELAKGVEALAPASEFPPAAGGWTDGLEVGGSHEWCVLSVSPKQRRISIALPREGAVAPEAIVVGAELQGVVQRIERYGVFVWLAPGRVGLMPREMTGEREGNDLRRKFHIGDSVEINVVDIEEKGRRIRLCKKGVKVEEPREDPRRRRDEPAPQPEEQGTFGTSLADKLRAALGQEE